jgi:hypothetical protein
MKTKLFAVSAVVCAVFAYASLASAQVPPGYQQGYMGNDGVCRGETAPAQGQARPAWCGGNVSSGSSSSNGQDAAAARAEVEAYIAAEQAREEERRYWEERRQREEQAQIRAQQEQYLDSYEDQDDDDEEEDDNDECMAAIGTDLANALMGQYSNNGAQRCN